MPTNPRAIQDVRRRNIIQKRDGRPRKRRCARPLSPTAAIAIHIPSRESSQSENSQVPAPTLEKKWPMIRYRPRPSTH